MRKMPHSTRAAALALAVASVSWASSVGNATIAPPRDRTLVLVGTVFSITQGGSKLKPWVVTIEIQKVLRGQYPGSWFSFAVHSPARSGLKQGRSYTVKAVWKGDADGSYHVDENQWNGPAAWPPVDSESAG